MSGEQSSRSSSGRQRELRRRFGALEKILIGLCGEGVTLRPKGAGGAQGVNAHWPSMLMRLCSRGDRQAASSSAIWCSSACSWATAMSSYRECLSTTSFSPRTEGTELVSRAWPIGLRHGDSPEPATTYLGAPLRFTEDPALKCGITALKKESTP